MFVTVGMLKGGASRTTTAVFLALAQYRRHPRPILLCDADPANGTAFEWAEDARDDGWPEAVHVRYWPVGSLSRRVEAAVQSEGYSSVIIDTGNDAAAVRAGLEVTDHLLVPIAPSGTESTRLTPTLEAAAEVAARRPIELSLLLTRTVHNSASRRQAREALTGMDLRVLTAEVPRLERFANAYGTAPRDLSPYTDVITELHSITKEGH